MNSEDYEIRENAKIEEVDDDEASTMRLKMMTTMMMMMTMTMVNSFRNTLG